MDVGSLLVRHDPVSAATVRRQISAELTGHRVAPDSIDDVLLVASELVGNAVTHAVGTELDVAWQLDEDSVLVRVNDTSSEYPRVLHVGAGSTGGRGMAIVAAIARDWGIRPLGVGKQVWARVPVHRQV